MKWTAGIFAGLLAAIVLMIAFLDWNIMRRPIANYLSGRMHRDVRLAGDLNVKLFSWTPTAVVNDLVIAQPAWAAQSVPAGTNSFAFVRRLTISLDVKQLLRWHVVLPTVDLEQPRLQFFRDTSGRANWNFDEDKNARPFRLPPIRHFTMREGSLDLRDVKRNMIFAGNFSSEETDGKSGAQFFKLTGQGKLNDAPFLAEIKGDPLLNIQPDHPYAFDAHVRAGATRIDAKGLLSKPFDLSAFQMNATFAGPDLADLYYLTGLALPNTPRYALSGSLTRNQETYRFHDFGGTVGESDLHGEVSVDVSGEKPYLKADLASQKLNFDDIGALIGARLASTGGQLAQPFAKATTPRETVVAKAGPEGVLPDVPLHVERLRQMDADVHYRATTVVSRDFPLRSAETQLSLKDAVLKLSPVAFNFAHGTLKGDIQIDARHDVPSSDIDVRLTGLDMGQFLPPATGMPALAGQAIARAKLHGTGNSIHKAASTANGTVIWVVPHGEIRQTFAELLGINVTSALGLLLTNDKSQVDVHCAVAGFSASNGILTLDQFAMDTPIVLASGEGTVDLRNERINLAITGHPKKPQLIRVRAPIIIKGPLNRPVVGVDAGSAIAQGGLSAGLALVLSPLAAILPFVDPGLGKDADCSALLAQAKSRGAPVAQHQARR